MNYFRMYPGDYLRDTSHLTPLQHGCFMLLLLNYYARNAPIPSDKNALYRIASAMTQDERDSVDFVVKSFFREENGLIHNSKADELIAHDLDKIESAKRSANARWNECERNANASKTHMQTQCSPAPAPAPAPEPAPSKNGAFRKPTPSEVVEYGESIGFKVDGEYFCSYYETRGWKLSGGVSMKSWQSAVVTWKKGDQKRAKDSKPAPVIRNSMEDHL